MLKGNVVKRVVALPMILCVTLLSLAFGLDSTKVAAATDEVSLISVNLHIKTKSGGYPFLGLGAKIKVKNIAYEKKVFIHYLNNLTGNWEDCQGTYLNDLGNGYEVWYCNPGFWAANPGYIEYAVCYQVAGQTYWDNNYGRNYITDAYGVTNF